MASADALRSSAISVASEAEAQEYYQRQRWTDGLPIMLPTPERVAAIVAGSGLAPDQLIALIPPGVGEATVEKIAVNAVMAGCRPEYMPVIIAAVRAMMESQFNLHAIQATTNPAGPAFIINGPIRHALDINCGSGSMGPGWRANATIGRAVRLILLNLGGATPGDVDKSTQGMPGKYTFCFGENEEESPWPPLHVERGFRREDSTVTVVAPSGTTNVTESSNSVDDLVKSLAYSIVATGSNNFRQAKGEPMLALCPPHAAMLARAGYSKDDVKRKLYQMARVPLSWLSENCKMHRAEAAPLEDPMPLALRWESFLIVVAGGPGGLHSTFLPTFGDTYAVTKKIEVP